MLNCEQEQRKYVDCIEKGGVVSVARVRRDKYAKENEQNQFFEVLDRRVDDMEAGRELPMQEAFQKINELRMVGRNARV